MIRERDRTRESVREKEREAELVVVSVCLTASSHVRGIHAVQLEPLDFDSLFPHSGMVHTSLLTSDRVRMPPMTRRSLPMMTNPSSPRGLNSAAAVSCSQL